MDETEALIHDTWGEETGSQMLVALRFFDAYFELYCALNEPWHGDEADQGVCVRPVPYASSRRQ